MKRSILARFPLIIRRRASEFMDSPLGVRMAGSAFWCVTGSLIARGVNFIYVIAAARILGLEEFGALGVIISTVGMAQILAGVGLGITATKHIAEYRRADPARAGRIIAMCEFSACGFGLLSAISLAILAPWLATHVFANPNLVKPLMISSVMLLLGALTGAQSGALAGFEAFQTVARVNAIAAVAGIPLMIAGGYFGGLNGILWGMTAPMVVQLILNHRALRGTAAECGVVIRIAGCWGEREMLWSFSFPAFLGNAIAAAVNWVCAALLVNSPHGYSEMGVYSAAFQWYNILIFLPDAIGQVALPMLSDRHGESSSVQTSRVLKNALKANAIMVLPLVLVGWALSPFSMRIFGPSFRGSGMILAVTIATAGLVSLEMPLMDLIASSGRMWMVAFINFGWAIVLMAFSFGLVHFGALGMVVARLGAYLMHAAVLIWVSSKIYSEMLAAANRNSVPNGGSRSFAVERSDLALKLTLGKSDESTI